MCTFPTPFAKVFIAREPARSSRQFMWSSFFTSANALLCLYPGNGHPNPWLKHPTVPPPLNLLYCLMIEMYNGFIKSRVSSKPGSWQIEGCNNEEGPEKLPEWTKLGATGILTILELMCLNCLVDLDTSSLSF